MDKLERDRQYQAKRYMEYKFRRQQLTQDVFHGKCFLCDATENFSEYHLHHVKYDANESDYERDSKSTYIREKRLQEATDHPHRFRLLCPDCHRMLTLLGSHVLRKIKMARRKRDIRVDALALLLLFEVDNRKEEAL